VKLWQATEIERIIFEHVRSIRYRYSKMWVPWGNTAAPTHTSQTTPSYEGL